ncbi:putative integral membrane protein (TIGR00698 family) [Leucobacter komagatae]|uniref:Putative integral membrane protein (TIGR00698 family) n=1 Tax=Leucobacter komagatae TaxID=55969 RepID=A0A542Y9F0_9MICO|nr:YeiH family protein [Leucobacter komagatae]TQL44677.1 putative integral membrane protein (TIGR00698 family) [Leucobacter komagatae]
MNDQALPPESSVAPATRTATHTAPAQEPSAPRGPRLAAWTRRITPGLLICLAAAGASYAVGVALPGVSPMIIAIVLGIVAANTGVLPRAAAPGIDFSAKKLLRAGIVFLGLQLVLGDIVALGAPVLAVIVCVVAGGLFGTVALGKLMKVPTQLTLLIACGFSICGAAAVAGAAGVTDPDDEHEQATVTAVALVVIFGTIMIPLVPFLGPVIGLTSDQTGMWAGASIHEIAQVVAVGGILGGTALTLAVVVKLARVLLLAPIMAVLSVRIRRAAGVAAAGAAAEVETGGQPGSQPKLPPIVPPFIIGFLAMVLLRSFVPLPEGALVAGQLLQTVLLSAAMFGLGCGVKVKSLLKVGFRPFALAALATVLVATIAYVGVLLVG